MTIEIVALKKGDEALLGRVAEGVFDGPVRSDWTAAYFANPAFLLIVARCGEVVVGMASGIIYSHPDKPPQLFLNELGVADHCRNQGIGRRLVQAVLKEARLEGCREAWVATEADNLPALRVYDAAGFERQPEEVVLFTIDLSSGQ